MNRRTMLGLALLLFVGCKGDDKPIDPVWGKQPCEHCKMLVDDRRSAAEVLLKNGEHAFFDDVGCMIAWADEHPSETRVFVRSGDGWIDARGARYVSGQKTPMDFGYVPSGAGDLDWPTIQSRVLSRLNEQGGLP